HLPLSTFPLSPYTTLFRSGIFSAARPQKWQTKFITTFASLSNACSIVWLSIIMIYLFCYQLEWLPDSQFHRNQLPQISGAFFVDIWFVPSPQRYQIFLGGLQHLILPIGIVSFYTTIITTYFMAQIVGDVLQQNYI